MATGAACAQSKPIPSRYDIDPVDIPHLLPGLSLLDAGEDLDALRYRLAGTRVREIYGTEITGRGPFSTADCSTSGIIGARFTGRLSTRERRCRAPCAVPFPAASTFF